MNEIFQRYHVNYNNSDCSVIGRTFSKSTTVQIHFFVAKMK